MRRPPPTPSRIIGDIRASTDEQHLSVEAQRDELARWCQVRQVTLATIYEDVGRSGGAPLEKRPGLLAALAALTRGRARLVVRRDRLARDTLAAAMAERIAAKAGGRILTADGSGAGDGPEAVLLRTISDALAQDERALIALRTKAGLRRKRAKGERVGTIPYGKRLDADGIHRLDHPAEQAVIGTVRALRAEGFSLREIAAELGQRGLTHRAGGRFNHTHVARMLGVA
jgi:site-specific DNA recombinase